MYRYLKIKERKMNKHSNNYSILEGIISIKSAVTSGKREIVEVLADKKKVMARDRKATYFISFLKQNGIKYTLKDRSIIDERVNEHFGSGTSHGGFIAYVKERSYMEFSDFLDKLYENKGYAVYLDGVEDPFNFGYSLRSLYAFGAYGFIMPERNWMTSANVVARSSAGASEMCEMTVAPDDEAALSLIKKKGLKIVCAALSANSVPIYDFSCSEPFILFIGGEKRGISPIFYDNADTIVHIPYKNENASYSLPTASVASIFGAHFASKK